MHSQSMKAPMDFIFMKSSSVLGTSSILSGPGNVKASKHRKNHLTTIQWQVRFDILNQYCSFLYYIHILSAPTYYQSIFTVSHSIK